MGRDILNVRYIGSYASESAVEAYIGSAGLAVGPPGTEYYVPRPGNVFYDSSAAALKIYSGSAWVTIGGGGGGGDSRYEYIVALDDPYIVDADDEGRIIVAGTTAMTLSAGMASGFWFHVVAAVADVVITPAALGSFRGQAAGLPLRMTEQYSSVEIVYAGEGGWDILDFWSPEIATTFVFGGLED